MPRPKPLLLAILDGFALNPDPRGNAVMAASKPNFDRLMQTHPHTTLITHGKRVGLPEGQMGNSEVGHLNIGAGRIAQQDLTRINEAVEAGTLKKNDVLRQLCAKLNAQRDDAKGALHIIGLVSLGGVHSDIKHIQAVIEAALAMGVRRVYVHAITDGRDRPPAAAKVEVALLSDFIKGITGPETPAVRIVSLVGRFYAMDRDKRWERIQAAYDLYLSGRGRIFPTIEEACETQYREGTTDEFLAPCVIGGGGESGATRITDRDGLLFCNFRADRMRQLVTAFTAPAIDFPFFPRSPLAIHDRMATLTEYDENIGLPVLFRPVVVKNHLGEVLASAGYRQLRIAETEKYAHVTYFFSGGREEALPGEDRILVPSPRDVATYDLKPEMNAFQVTEQLLRYLRETAVHTVILNFANCDMVAHTGVYAATVKAVEVVDLCLGRILDEIAAQGGTAIVTADHGNADQMIEYDTGAPHTYHTKHPVPFILVSEALKSASLRESGALCDIAPTILECLGLRQPPEMTGKSLIVR